MTESTQTPAATPDTAATGAPQGSRFRRSRRDRMLAGVCGGVGEALGVDPVVIRVAVVVLTFFGGAGVVAYIAGWLLLPDGAEASPVRRALGRRGGEAWTGLALIGLLALAVVITLDSLVSGWGPGHHRGPFPLLLLVGLFGIGYLLLRRRDAHPPAGGPPPPSGPAPSDPTTALWAAAAPTTGPTSTVPIDLGKSDGPTGPGGPPPAPQPRSMLGLATFSLILIAIGALAVAQTLGVDVPPPAYPAVLLAGSGVGLLIGSRYGRARGLIGLGVLGLVAVGPAAVAGEFEGRWVADGEIIRPALTGGLASEYRYRVGDMTLDLSSLDLAGGSAATRISLGAGEIEVILPSNVDVVIDAKVRVGEFDVLGSRADGFDNHHTVRDEGPDGPGGGTLNLTINQGLGHLQVVRVPSPSPPSAPQIPAPPADPFATSTPEVTGAPA